MNVEVKALARKGSEINRFLEVSYGIYDGDPHWVAPLLMDLKRVFTDENPLFDHAEMQCWVATRGGKDVGRIAGILDREYLARQPVPAAYLGFYECVEDGEVSRALFESVYSWARAKGCRKILGPMNPTANDECGLLVEGFDLSPTIMMTYNPAYYARFFEAAGLRKAKDLLAYHIDMATMPMDRLTRLASKVLQRNPEVSLRLVRKKTLSADLWKIKEVYNAAWDDNWGFVPITDKEVDFMADRLKPLFMEGLVWVAEVGSEPVGFLLAMPDFNPAIRPLRGRVLTPKLLGFLPYLLGWKRPEGTRVLTLGVKKAFRGRGLETAMLVEGLKVGYNAGFKVSEASWILEDNVPMNRIMQAIDGQVHKRYRLYDRELS